MLRFYVDFNMVETRPTEELIQKARGSLICVRPDMQPGTNVNEEELRVGMVVIVYDEAIECQAILHRGRRVAWIGEMIPETLVYFPEEEWAKRNPYTQSGE